MGFCGKRYFFLSICVVQVLTVIERQAFDFLGFLWIPILFNFFEVIFIILGFFGAYQFRPRYVLSYLIWHQIWLAWNIFLICLYLNVAGLDHKQNKVIKLDPKSESWWRTSGPGCKKNEVATETDIWNSTVENCSVDYVHIEVFQASLQVFLSILGVIFGICLHSNFCEQDDTSQRKANKTPKRTSLYSIEFSSQIESHNNDSDEFDHITHSTSPKPMTPRRVKRRSVMTRGTSSRRSTNSRRHNGARSSTRSSRRSIQNPVTKLLEQQQQQQNHQYDSPASPSTIDSIASVHWAANGHANPTYQQSSTQSLNEDLDDIYNNRPASVRSSYSNFHGARTLNYTGPKHYHSHATPQVPQKRSVLSSQQNRPVAFLNAGPPAYTSQGQVAVTIAADSETAI